MAGHRLDISLAPASRGLSSVLTMLGPGWLSTMVVTTTILLRERSMHIQPVPLRALLVAMSLAAGATTAHGGLISSSAAASLTGASLIDFEGIGSFETNSFSTGGVTFAGAIEYSLRCLAGCRSSLNVAPFSSAGWGLSGSALQTPYAYAGGMTIQFGSAVSAFGLDWYSGEQPYDLHVYDPSGSLLAAYQVPVTMTGFWGVENVGAIGSVSLRTSSRASEWLLVDNLRFSLLADPPAPDPQPDPQPDPAPNPVPLPSTLALTVLGLGLLTRQPTMKRA